MTEPKQKPGRKQDRQLLGDMAAYIRDLCQHHDRLKVAGHAIGPRATQEYERGIALLERMPTHEG